MKINHIAFLLIFKQSNLGKFPFILLLSNKHVSSVIAQMFMPLSTQRDIQT